MLATASDTRSALDRLDADGYVVLERAVGDDVLQRIRDELDPYLGDDALHGRNDFEGFSTNRVYALLAKAPSVAELVEHPAVVAILDALLLPGCLLSANLAINLLPGETAQTLHFDDGFYRVPRPRPAIGVSAIWAIDEFTAENGATQIIPGSHRWGAEQPAEDDPTIVAVAMPAGSVVVFLGTLWHRGGANRTDRAAAGDHAAVLRAVGPPAGADGAVGRRRRGRVLRPRSGRCSATASTRRSWATSTGCTRCACSIRATTRRPPAPATPPRRCSSARPGRSTSTLLPDGGRSRGIDIDHDRRVRPSRGVQMSTLTAFIEGLSPAAPSTSST